MQADFHIHTVLCKHAAGTTADYLESARQKNISVVGFTDHAPAPDGYDAKHRMAVEDFPKYEEMILELRKSSHPKVLYGIEADYYQGCEKFLRPWLARQNFDMVIGSIHFIRDWGFDNPNERNVWDSIEVTNTWREYFKLMRKMAESRLYDVVAHLDLPKKFGHIPPARDLFEMLCPALDSIAEAGMVIELNTSGLRRPVKEIYPSLSILKLARERNIPICFGSDAHRPEEVGYAFDSALDLARAAGYSHCVHFQEGRKLLTPLAQSQ
jgi:histidinol-phosphatase (PHP family)